MASKYLSNRTASGTLLYGDFQYHACSRSMAISPAMPACNLGRCSTTFASPSAFTSGNGFNLELITDMFNIANKFNVAAVNQLWTAAGQPTAAYDPRQFQFAMKLYW